MRWMPSITRDRRYSKHEAERLCLYRFHIRDRSDPDDTAQWRYAPPSGRESFTANHHGPPRMGLRDQ